MQGSGTCAALMSQTLSDYWYYILSLVSKHPDSTAPATKLLSNATSSMLVARALGDTCCLHVNLPFNSTGARRLRVRSAPGPGVPVWRSDSQTSGSGRSPEVSTSEPRMWKHTLWLELYSQSPVILLDSEGFWALELHGKGAHVEERPSMLGVFQGETEAGLM